METAVHNYPKAVATFSFKKLVFLVATLSLFTIRAIAESASGVSDVVAETQKDLEHQNYMSYVYMVLGFLAIVGVAWISVIRNKNGDKGINNTTHQHLHHHHHHDIHDKRYGTHRAK